MSTSGGDERLAELRERIDEIDSRIIDLLAERFAVTRSVGIAKRDAGLPPVDEEREEQMYRRFRARATEHGLEPDLVESIYRVVIGRVIAEHRSLAEGHVLGES